MDSVKKTTHNIFSWQGLGDIKLGRPELGDKLPVFVYRMLEYSLLDVLVKEFGADKANEIFFGAGRLAGLEFARNNLDLQQSLSDYIAALSKALRDNLMGILQIEEFDSVTLDFIIVVKDDLDCSGLKSTNEVVCHFDEGLIAGVMEAYTGKTFMVKEVDCWAKGDRLCRFRGWVIPEH